MWLSSLNIIYIAVFCFFLWLGWVGACHILYIDYKSKLVQWEHGLKAVQLPNTMCLWSIVLFLSKIVTTKWIKMLHHASYITATRHQNVAMVITMSVINFSHVTHTLNYNVAYSLLHLNAVATPETLQCLHGH